MLTLSWSYFLTADCAGAPRGEGRVGEMSRLVGIHQSSKKTKTSLYRYHKSYQRTYKNTNTSSSTIPNSSPPPAIGPSFP